jgi:hypothetical protein
MWYWRQAFLSCSPGSHISNSIGFNNNHNNMETTDSKPSKLRKAIALCIAIGYALTMIISLVVHELNI